jgi:GGDEF domain-containing protein
MLRDVAQRFVDAVGDAGAIGRLGGDEFAIWLPDAQVLAAVRTGRELLSALIEPFELDGHVHVTVDASIG